MNKDDTPEEAEKNVVDYFFRYLYKAPAKVLVVGTGLDLLPKRLMEKGFEYTGISKDKTVIKKSKKRFPDAEFLHTDLKELETEMKYDIIIFRESADQGSFSSLFEKAGSLLTEGGRILVMDTFSGNKQNPRNMKKFVNTAKKEGFALNHVEDLSSLILPDIEYKRYLIRTYRDRITKKLGITSEQIDEVTDRLKETEKRFRNKKLSYVFMELQKTETKERKANEESGMVESLAAEMVPAIKEKEKGRKKRALLLTLIPLTHVGGIEKINQNIADLLHDHGWEVDARCTADIQEEALSKYLLGTDTALFECLAFAGVLDWKSYDLVVSNNNAGGACHPTEKTKVVAISHGIFSGVGKEVEHAFPGVFPPHVLSLKNITEEISYSNKSGLIAVSQQVSDELLELFGQKSHVVVNGFEFERFRNVKSELREKYAIPKEALVAIYAGRLDPVQKRSDITIELARLFPDIYWVFATDKVDPRYKQYKNIIVILSVPYEEMPALYAGVDFAMQLSSYEGFSNFAMETIATKIPMISTKTGIIDEVYMGTPLEPLLIEQDMSHEVILKRAAQKVTLLRESYPFYKKASEELYETAKETFSLKAWREKMTRILGL
ncbi:glycosyltransferase [Sulfurovum lithotrophicum]|nr:glycosyltransferase [Sulfurovum lithotrophicum]